MSDPRALPPRSAIPQAQTCDIESVFASPAHWDAECVALDSALPDLAHFQGRLHQGPGVLVDWLAASEAWWRRYGRLSVYAGMCHCVDTADEVATAREDRARALGGRAAATCAFAEPELLALGVSTLAGYLAEEPRLASHAHAFDRLERSRAHLRSAEVEEVLGGLGDPFDTAASTHGVLADADLRFAPARGADGTGREVAQGTIWGLMADADREVRRTAYESYADGHLAVRHTMANCIATGVKQHVLLARTRRYGSALEAALGPNHIPTAVFHNLIAAFRRHLPTWHRYWRMRRTALGYDRLYEYDIKAPLTRSAPAVPYAEAVAWIAAGMAPLGAAYVETLRRGATAARWVDARANRGKRAGAFSSGAPGTPPYILMSYTDDLYGLSTLAHELGHSLHTLYAGRAQPYVYSDYSIFVAEVASNFNQALVREHLLRRHPERDFQVAALEEAMSNFHRYFFIMPTLARFELECHERVERGLALTAGDLSTLLADLFSEGYGGEVEVERERVGITWAEFPTHLYANFYVYQYATGISAAQALAEGVLAGAPGAAQRYIAFLEAGGSRYPIDALAAAGVDMTDPNVVERGFGALEQTVAHLEGWLG